MESLQQILVFAAEVLLVVVGVGAVAILIAQLVAKSSHRSDLEIESLDKRYRKLGMRVKSRLLPAKEFKKLAKAEKTENKDEPTKATTYVLDFKGDVKAGAVECLREEITALLKAAGKDDEVVVRLESPGGMVHGYGLAAAQLIRLKDAGLKVTICVDKVAASGGYMMACTAHRIVAAPFAIVGSIGVVAQVPNFNRLLKKHDVEYKEYTAGEFKRTVSLLGEITEKGEQKFKEQLEDTHILFKDFVKEQRPALDVSKVATGEYWYGRQALALGLVDAISTSDDVLLKAAETRRVLSLKLNKKQPFNEKLSGLLGRALKKGLLESAEELESRRWV